MVDSNDRGRQLERFRRQVLQRVPLPRVSWPQTAILGEYDVQERVYEQTLARAVGNDLSADGAPSRWLKQFCTELAKRVAEAAEVSDEGDVFDPLIEECARVQKSAVLHEVEDAQKDVLVTYVAGKGLDGVEVTLLEKPRVVSGSGFTGHRTWEAALVLAHELIETWIPQGRLANKRMLELGVGTGLLSYVCASPAARAAFVLATDGDPQAIDSLRVSSKRNEQIETGKMACGVYHWGDDFNNNVIGKAQERGDFDLILGADVTYDPLAIPDLVKTLHRLFLRNAEARCVISATIRNETTVAVFEAECASHNLKAIRKPAPRPTLDNQECFFRDTAHDVWIFDVKSARANT